ncbi:protein translocase subunit SecDF [Neptunitalea chrysea]|uniref:Multifunctional fusion protein n=1 Tax=Neptunitalea chrysea TaxID=1647581 RepID=A0A9W6EUI7_9FLAO|nr:protein translocase subunit SecDF [Neptunitalea chrysea]GLB53555.1 protein translocase subunit SecDF [Neptunitalea chrysea]
MQNKGLIKLFAFLFGIVSIYQLSFTFITNKLEEEAKTVAQSRIPETEDNYVALREEEESKYLDSLKTQDVFLGFTLSDVQERQLNKGLDLKGGINVILQISVKDILIGLSNKSTDKTFLDALAAADEASKSSDEPYLDLFFKEFEKLSNGQVKLSSPQIFYNRLLDEEFNMGDDNAVVMSAIRKKVDESITSAFQVLRQRIDKFGVTQPNIQRLGTSGRILVELPGVQDVDRAKRLLQSTAQLEFWETYMNTDVLNYFSQLNNELKAKVEAEEKAHEEVDTTKTSGDEFEELLADSETDSLNQAKAVNPLFEVMGVPNPNSGQKTAIVGYTTEKDVEKVNEYLNTIEAKRLLPASLDNVKFVWDKVDEDTGVVNLYAIKGNRDNVPPVSGDVIVDAEDTFDQAGNPMVSIVMNGIGSRAWESLTGKSATNGTCIAIILDNTVYSAPSAKQAITGGRTTITGQFTIEETKDLANVLRAGKLPAKADIIQFETVGPTLGQEAIDSGFMSFMIAMVLVLIWMMIYYGKAGIFSNIALVFNILLIFGALASIGAVLTLPGIAGIVLTIGMAVDANVIIYERIKEEMAVGKTITEAIKDGFSNALSSILDANITTGLTAIILLIFGTGPIQGFATTLLIGILTSLFTAIFITRVMIEGYIGENKRRLDFYTGATKNLFKNINVDFLSKRKIAYVVSGVLILAGLASLFTKGLDQGVDFVGGRTYQIRFDKEVSSSEISKDLEGVFNSNVQVKTVGNNSEIKVTTKYKVDEEGQEVDTEIEGLLYSGLEKYLPEGFSKSDFVDSSSDKKYGILHSIKVGPTIADDIQKSALWAVLGSLAVVFLYILLRFRKWQYSLGAVVAVFHDVLLVLGVFSVTYSFMPFSMEIDQAFIAAILTVIGYSLNDTVIVFDRVREITNERGWKGGENVNQALSSTLGRTLNTSLTTLVVMISIFIFGGESLRGFVFAMIVGVVVGTYSSLFIATPIMYDTIEKKNAKTTTEEE